MADVIVREVCHVLHFQLVGRFENHSETTPTLWNGFNYHDFGDLVERHGWGGSLDRIEPVAGNHATLAFAVECLVIVRHSLGDSMCVQWNKDLLNQRAIDTCADLQFPDGSLEDLSVWELCYRDRLGNSARP